MKLLLDEHLSPILAKELEATGIEATALRDWENGVYLEASDGEILNAACAAGWSLVTYDLRTIPRLLKEWGESSRDHNGVVFVDQRTIASNDYGALLQALGELNSRLGEADWRNRVVYLTRKG